MRNILEPFKIADMKSSKMVIAFSVVSLFMAITLLIVRRNSAFDRALLNLAAIIFGTTLLWFKFRRLTKFQISFTIIMSIFGILASLLFTENYAGGEWLFHLHKGYPFSWIDGGLSVLPAIEKGIPVAEYVAKNPEMIQWSVDIPALVIDSFFWINLSIIIHQIIRSLIEMLRKYFQFLPT